MGSGGEVQRKLRDNGCQHPDVKGDAHMRQLVPICGILAVALFLATIAAAQTTSVSGQIIAPDGTPWVDLDVTAIAAARRRHAASPRSCTLTPKSLSTAAGSPYRTSTFVCMPIR